MLRQDPVLDNLLRWVGRKFACLGPQTESRGTAVVAASFRLGDTALFHAEALASRIEQL